MECPVPYGIIHDIHALSRWEAGQNACLRIVLSTGSVLLQVSIISSGWSYKGITHCTHTSMSYALLAIRSYVLLRARVNNNNNKNFTYNALTTEVSKRHCGFQKRICFPSVLLCSSPPPPDIPNFLIVFLLLTYFNLCCIHEYMTFHRNICSFFPLYASIVLK